MKKIFLVVALMASSSLVFSQGDFKIGFRLAPSVNIASVKDNDGTSSGEKYTADGLTTKESNVAGMGVSFYFDYFLTKNIAFSSGLWFAQKNFRVRNTDGEYYFNGKFYAGNPYSGVSQYNSTYLQLPILFKYVSNELVGKLRFYVTFGPTIDLKVGESLSKNYDGAHYWNMSRNIIGNDYARGRNASNKAVALFNPIDITLYLSGGVNYEIVDKLDLFAGIMFNKGFVNLVNPKLKFAEPNQTKVNSDISWKAFLVGLELGVAYKIN